MSVTDFLERKRRYFLDNKPESVAPAGTNPGGFSDRDEAGVQYRPTILKLSQEKPKKPRKMKVKAR